MFHMIKLVASKVAGIVDYMNLTSECGICYVTQHVLHMLHIPSYVYYVTTNVTLKQHNRECIQDRKHHRMQFVVHTPHTSCLTYSGVEQNGKLLFV